MRLLRIPPPALALKWAVSDRAKVYLDSNIYKFSATALTRAQPRQKSVKWGGRELIVTVHDIVSVNPNEGITNNPDLKAEAELLPRVAALAAGIVEFVIDI